jgi:UDP-N-acetylmuramoyl-L-alanyl-D-glutamate--2,6-diaminopimelate ligase
VAVFTNLTRDHLDYHGSMEAYAAAKEKLFHWPRLRLVVINLDDAFGRELMLCCPASRIAGYTQEERLADRQGVIRAEAVEDSPRGLAFTLAAPTGRARVETRLRGRFNVSNLLAVAAVLLDAGLAPSEVAARFATLAPPPGRLETLGGPGEPLIVVDYAHTPDALENAFAALRGTTVSLGGRLIAVFGCGGGRDRGKRPLMGEAARRLADRVVLTSDNPRGEDPEAILAEIAVPEAEVIADRGAAIRRTILAAKAADVVLLAGKGHEAYQEIAGVKRPFSDLDEARAALACRRGEGR